MYERHRIRQRGNFSAHLLVIASDEIEHVAAVHNAQQVEHEERQAVVQALSQSTVLAVSVNMLNDC